MVHSFHKIYNKFKANGYKKEANNILFMYKNKKQMDADWKRVLDSFEKNFGFLPHAEQIWGSLELLNEKIIEMATGEGKTLTAAMAAAMAGINGRKIVVITANQYLVERDSSENKSFFEELGLTVGYTGNNLNLTQKKEMYSKDILYSTASQLGFDFLKNNRIYSIKEDIGYPYDFVIIDEIDSILIDEATMPLILSDDGHIIEENLRDIHLFLKTLDPGKVNKKEGFFEDESFDSGDFILDEKKKSAYLTESGIEKIEKHFNFENLSDSDSGSRMLHLVNMAISAEYLYKKGEDYLVKDNGIVLIDRNTGRLVSSRKMSGGLHQSIEAKESLEISPETKNIAQITYHSLIKMFNSMAGMSGTVCTEQTEFLNLFSKEIVKIEKHGIDVRKDFESILFKTKELKKSFLIKLVRKEHATGRPILIGTQNVIETLSLKEELEKQGFKVNVLNAENEFDEARIISKAGNLESITIATNMAGRGVDIVVDPMAEKNGGLLIIGYEVYKNKRIDNQLRGRTGRQGARGETIFLSSTEDILFENLSKKELSILEKYFADKDALSGKDVDQLIENIQRKYETIGYQARKFLMDFDQSQRKQREIILNARKNILFAEKDDLISIMKDFSMKAKLKDDLFIEEKIYEIHELGQIDFFRKKILSLIDNRYDIFINEMNSILDGIDFLGIAQKDPRIEFQRISFKRFEIFLKTLRNDIIKLLKEFYVEKVSEEYAVKEIAL